MASSRQLYYADGEAIIAQLADFKLSTPMPERPWDI
jgi:hypothetical protein